MYYFLIGDVPAEKIGDVVEVKIVLLAATGCKAAQEEIEKRFPGVTGEILTFVTNAP